ncbi:MAG TPA: DUF3109 family protein [Chitinophagales bacterium]|jgi:hypothetical protein|nr:DUF3109 family protein [Chitinophagales bacterium]MBP6154122.1 DUF3109 family protein [Chitinophagales bacterium]HQV77006.1 DUF3109 family protein [Chitinophagales bacterium]HQW77927.1 DUF3109 family protein [Chitinophagales bacterium]HRB66347.1 DUF3109 family protein [Chitinophagales bacterium]
MILIDDKLISDDVVEKHFVCNIKKCKGICCVEGDSGAPVEKNETKILKKIYPKIKKYLLPEGIKAIEEQGTFVAEPDDEYTAFATPLIDGGACAYVNYEQDGTITCAIEKAWKDGVIDFQKPISCHLYPIRLKPMDTIVAVNYDEWDICSDACKLGAKLKVPLYVFVKDALVRKFGDEFYSTLEYAAQEHEKKKTKR